MLTLPGRLKVFFLDRMDGIEAWTIDDDGVEGGVQGWQGQVDRNSTLQRWNSSGWDICAIVNLYIDILACKYSYHWFN